MKNKNKVVIKDDYGNRWFAHKNGIVEPVNWKQQCQYITAVLHQQEVKEQLYGKPKENK